MLSVVEVIKQACDSGASRGLDASFLVSPNVRHSYDATTTNMNSPSFADDVKTPSMMGSQKAESDKGNSNGGINGENMFSRMPSRRNNLPLYLAFLVVGYLFYSMLWSPHFLARNCPTKDSSWIPDLQTASLVPLEAHIMSKCPDAQDCLKMLVLPTMQRVYSKVNFTLSYIGTPTDNDGVDCMHGPEECMGNIIELCAAKLYPDPKSYLGFTMCLTKDYKSIPQRSLVEDCALEHGLDFEKINECTLEDNGGTAMALLRDSVRRSTKVGVTKSCTVRLNDEIYCVRDGREWKECPHGAGVNDLVIAVEKLSQGQSSEEKISPSKAR